MDDKLSSDLYRKGYLVLGCLAAIGLAGYGLAYIIVMPAVDPGGFIPQEAGATGGAPAGFGIWLAAFILLYAFAFLPVVVLFTIRQYKTNPYALVPGGCLMCLSLIIEIINNLPLLAAGIQPVRLAEIPVEVALYLRQMETIRYLSFDVAGFSLAYAAIFVYALVYFKTQRLLAYVILGSIALFILNVPCLWFSPNAAVILMALSVLAFAFVPVRLAWLAAE